MSALFLNPGCSHATNINYALIQSIHVSDQKIIHVARETFLYLIYAIDMHMALDKEI